MSASSEAGPRRRRWRLSDLIGLVAFVAIGFGTYRAVANEPWLVDRLKFGVFLAGLAISGVLAFSSPRRARPFWRGWAAFSGLFLVCALRGWFAVWNDAAARGYATYALLGLPLALLSGIACQALADRGGAP